MLQQINFYPLLPKPAKYSLTPVLGLRLIVGLVALLFLVYVCNLIIFFWQQQKLTELRQTRQMMQAHLIRLNAQYNGDIRRRPLRWQNEQLTLALQDKQHKLVELKQTKIINEQNYAGYLIGFATAIKPNVWLNQIHITTANQQVDLTGNAANSNAVMQFIQNLGKQAIFNGKAFNVIRLENLPDKANFLNFALSTNAREQNALNTKTNP